MIVDAWGTLSCQYENWDHFNGWRPADWKVYCNKSGLCLGQIQSLGYNSNQWRFDDNPEVAPVIDGVAKVHGLRSIQLRELIDTALDLPAMGSFFYDLTCGPDAIKVCQSKLIAIENNPSLPWVRFDGQTLTIRQFSEAWAECRAHLMASSTAKSAKKKAIQARRSAFSLRRSELVLSLLDAGHEYICAVSGCFETTDLTVDHKHPISRGGTDDIKNLQFLCRSCNSKKGANAA